MYGYRVKPQSQELRGKRFSFARSIEEDVPLAKSLVKEIVRRGGRYSLKLTGCNVFVQADDDASVRTDAARRMYDEGKIAEFMTLSELQGRLFAEEE